MLFRRIKKHVKKENWFAVFIDFFIVVIGVFFGLQVQQSYEASKDRTLETTYIKRLHTEVVNLETVRALTTKERELGLVDLNQATKRVLDPEGEDLTDLECEYVGTLLSVTNPTDDLPLIIELLSSGRITIFTDVYLEKALGDYLIARSRARDSQAGISAKIPRLPTKHDRVFEIKKSLTNELKEFSDLADAGQVSPEDWTGYGNAITCDTDAMRANVPFKNDLANMEMQFFYHVDDNRRVSAALADLHKALDEILDTSHDKDNAP